MKPIAMLFAAALAATFPALADPPSPMARAEMAKIGQMAGRWKGGGWVFTQAGRREFESTELMEWRLDGYALVVEGRHTDAKTGELTHHAIATIAWDEKAGEYRFLSALNTGMTGAYPAKLDGKKFIWSIPPATRFTISLDDPDKWLEVGEYSRDGGATWTRFFEMKLDRVKL